MRIAARRRLLPSALLGCAGLGLSLLSADEFLWYDAVSGPFDASKNWAAPDGVLYPESLRNPNPNNRKPGSNDTVSFRRYGINDALNTGVAYEVSVPAGTTVAGLKAEMNARVGTYQPMTFKLAGELEAGPLVLEWTTLTGGGTIRSPESRLGNVTLSGNTTARLTNVLHSSAVFLEDRSSLIVDSLNNDAIGLKLRGASTLTAESIVLRGGPVPAPSPDISENSTFTAKSFEFIGGMMRVRSGSKLILGQVKRRDPNFGSIGIEVTNPGSEWILETPIESPSVKVSDGAYVNLGPEVTHPSVSAWGTGSKLEFVKALGRGSILALDGGQVTASEVVLNGRVGAATKGAVVRIEKSLTLNGIFSAYSTGDGATNAAALARITGTLEVSGQDTVAAFGTLYLGDEPGFTSATLQEKGRMLVRDGGTNWISSVPGSDTRLFIATGAEWAAPNANEFVVGKKGLGLVSLSDGKLRFGPRQNSGPPGQGTDDATCEPEPGPSTPETPKFVIGGEPDSKGTVTLTSPKAEAEINGERFYIGDQGGEGTLELRNGAHLKLGVILMTLGREQPAKGTLRLDGPGTQVEGIQTGRDVFGTKLEIGRHGEGLVDILNGAEFKLPSLILGCFETSKGSIRVSGKAPSGTASLFESDGSITIGSNGRGSLEVLSGAQARSYKNAVIGRYETGEGMVTVRGADSKWSHTLEKNGTDAGSLVVGMGGKGTLVVADQAQFEAGNVVIGEKPDPNARGGAEGTLIITNGARVNVQSGIAFLTLGKEFGSKGTLIMDGANSKLLGIKNQNNGPGATLELGLHGEGRLVLSNSATMKLPSVILGSRERSRGTLHVTSGSTFESDGSITVGGASTGIVEVASGAVLKSNSDAIIGRDPKSEGAITLTGQGTRWTHGPKADLLDSGSILVGQKSKGELTIVNGAFCETDNLIVGLNAEGHGTVTVRDTGSRLQIKGLSLGDRESSGAGSLTIRNGATVNVGNSALSRIMTVHSPTDDASQLRVHGVNSKLHAPDVKLLVGGTEAEGLPANVSLEAGGEASTGGVSIGFGGGTASVEVTDARWVIEESKPPGLLNIGNAGKGVLQIHERGVVSVRGSDDKTFPRVELGRTEGSRLELDGEGARLETSLLSAFGDSEMLIGKGAVAEGSRQVRIDQAKAHVNGGELHAGAFAPMLNASLNGIYIPFPILYRQPFVAVSGHNQGSLIQLIVENKGVLTVGRSLILQSAGNASWELFSQSGRISLKPNISPEIAGVRLTQGSIDIGELSGNPEPGKVRVGKGGVLVGIGFILGPEGTEVKMLGGDIFLLPWPGAIVLPRINLPNALPSSAKTRPGPVLQSGEETENPELTGTLTVQGAVSFETNSTLHVLIRGATPVREYGVLGVTGPLTLGGQLVLHFDRGFAPTKGESIHILNASAPALGQFNSVAITGLAPGFQYDLKWNDQGAYTLTALNDGIATTPPALSIDPTAGGLKVSWPGNLRGFSLQSTTNLSLENWIPIPTTTNEWVIDPSLPSQFFRLIQ